MTVRIVTDSTCDIPPALAQQYGITVLPTYVNVGDESYLDGVDLTRAEFYERLPQYRAPITTAAPAIGVFTAAYEQLAREGASAVLSIHLASDLSALLNVARLGAEEADGVPVTVFDSRQISMGLGFLVLTAARAAQEGASVAEITALLQHSIPRTHVFAMLDTLEYLRRSGRVSWPEFGLGSLLRIKPLVHVHQGAVNSLAKIRTQSRALDHMLQHIAGLGPLRHIALLHTANPQGAQKLQQQAAHLIPPNYDPVAVEVTPTIGAHVGPGALGFACIVD